jgi:hypothetical protein
MQICVVNYYVGLYHRSGRIRGRIPLRGVECNAPKQKLQYPIEETKLKEK